MYKHFYENLNYLNNNKTIIGNVSKFYIFLFFPILIIIFNCNSGNNIIIFMCFQRKKMHLNWSL